MSGAGADRLPPRDPARQPERTRLAWRRTVLAATVVMLLVVRQALIAPAAGWLRVPAVLLAIAAWLAVVLLGAARISAMRAPQPAPVRWPVPVLVVGALGLAGLGLLLIPA